MQAIGINGITGRMGRLIAAAVTDHADCQLVGGLSRKAFTEVNGLLEREVEVIDDTLTAMAGRIQVRLGKGARGADMRSVTWRTGVARA